MTEFLVVVVVVIMCGIFVLGLWSYVRYEAHVRSLDREIEAAHGTNDHVEVRKVVYRDDCLVTGAYGNPYVWLWLYEGYCAGRWE